ncbi:unnamed protein product [Larinioides sclopetarius]|uniref:Uncharacterized protein n=2 Tax=Araneidae TaxID=6913 RepID=A0AAV2A8R4_9ARAC
MEDSYLKDTLDEPQPSATYSEKEQKIKQLEEQFSMKYVRKTRESNVKNLEKEPEFDAYSVMRLQRKKIALSENTSLRTIIMEKSFHHFAHKYRLVSPTGRR